MSRVLFLFWGLEFLMLGISFAQNQNPKFRRLTTNEGLSHGFVTSIQKDHKGFMWFGTGEGLNKYDGYHFTAYKHDPEQATSISHNIVRDVLEDQAGNLWVATSGGLDKFDREKEAFIHYNPGGLLPVLRDIFQDSKNQIWLGTENGLYLFNPATGNTKH